MSRKDAPPDSLAGTVGLFVALKELGFLIRREPSAHMNRRG